MRPHPLAVLALLSACSTSPAQQQQAPTPLDCSDDDADWPMWGQNVCNTRVQKNGDALTTTSAKKLALKWTFAAAGDVSATPAVVAGKVYVPDWGGNLNVVEAATGKAVWSKGVAALAKLVDASNQPIAGMISRTTPVVTGSNVVFGTQLNAPMILFANLPSAYLVAVDKDSGALAWKTPLHEGHPAAVITGSPVLDGARLYVGVSSLEEAFSINAGYKCCSFRGSVAAVDAATGKLVWQSHTIEDSAYYEADGKTPSGFSGAAVWSSTPVVDRKRHALYVTTGNAYSAPAGTKIPPSGVHAESIVALDLETGAFKWSRHITPPELDVWTFSDTSGPDYDFGCGANLFTATIKGQSKDLVGAGQKSGVYTAVDADTGDVVWQQTVGPGGHLGGIHWGTAYDGKRIYVGVNNENAAAFKLGGSGSQAGTMAKVGAWAALDPATGAILWQVANPASPKVTAGVSVNGPVTVAGGVLFAGSMDPAGTMYALDASSGDVLWSFQAGGTVYGGPAVVGGVVYWGAGYVSSRLGFGTSVKKLYAFAAQ